MPPQPVRTHVHSTKSAPTPSSSLRGWLSRTLASLRGESTEPTPKPAASPTVFEGTPGPRLETPPQTYLNASPVQDGYFTTSDHVRLHYLEAGQGLAIVLIPGWLLPAEIWKPQLEGLSDDYHVIALDPRSQGESDMTPKGNEPIRQAKDIQELLDHLQLTSVVLVGWSHGGFQVLAYLGQYGPDRLYAAALVDSALAASSSTTSTVPRVRFLDQFQKDRVNATRGFVWGLFKKHPPMDYYRRLIAAAERTPTGIALDLMNNAFPGDSYQPSLPTLRQIPLLYAVTPKYTTQAAYLLQVDPLARVEFFKESGHALFYDEADHFNDVMRDFLRRSALYPAGFSENKRKPAGPVPTHSYLENPK
jgi:non-heme chloroperoxidase